MAYGGGRRPQAARGRGGILGACVRNQISRAPKAREHFGYNWQNFGGSILGAAIVVGLSVLRLGPCTKGCNWQKFGGGILSDAGAQSCDKNEISER